jgi:hypothetical protein
MLSSSIIAHDEASNDSPFEQQENILPNSNQSKSILKEKQQEIDSNVLAFVNHQLASLGFPCLYNLKKDSLPVLNTIYSLLQQKQVGLITKYTWKWWNVMSI